jgi:hypothetical protein
MPYFNLTSHGGGTGIIGGRAPGLKPFLTRQIIARGYVAGGYANSSPWTDVSSINASTDVAGSHGNLLGSAGGYIGGGCSLTTGYAFGSGGMGNYSTASRFNMVTKTGQSDMSMPYTVGDCESIQDNAPGTGGARGLWINGNSSSGGMKLTVATDTYSGFSTSLSQAGTGASSHMTELWGIWWDDNATNRKFVFATETESANGGAAGFYGQQKGISTKLGKGYAGNEGSYNAGNNLRIWNYVTESLSGTVGKPIGNSGEENFDMGQDHQYMLGMYNGAQNNRAWRLNYSTDSGYELGTSGQPSAPGSGRSSGGCSWCSV